MNDIVMVGGGTRISGYRPWINYIITDSIKYVQEHLHTISLTLKDINQPIVSYKWLIACYNQHKWIDIEEYKISSSIKKIKKKLIMIL